MAQKLNSKQKDGVMPLQLNTRHVGDVVTVDCSGKLVFGEETTALRELVEKLLFEHREIMLNFADVTYVDSSGLGLLMALHESARKIGATIKLAALNAKIHDLLQLTRLAMVLEIVPSVDDTVADPATAKP